MSILEKHYGEAKKIFAKLRESGSLDTRPSAGLVNTYIAESQFDKPWSAQ